VARSEQYRRLAQACLEIARRAEDHKRGLRCYTWRKCGFVWRGLAEFERHLILARTDEGRKRAQARGVKFGRKLKLTPHQQEEALARRARGEALIDIARSYNVSHSTISRLEAGAG
jgi:hypothetical protein